MPPTSKMMGPPPGATPQGLTSMVPPAAQLAAEAGPELPKPPGGGGGLKDVFDEVSGVLDSLAGILPDQAAEIDAIKVQLAEVLAKAISGGAAFKGQTEQAEQIRPTPSFPA
jgi:hypothetical protein